MTINDDELRRLEVLARISLNENERARLRDQFGRIIDFVRKLEEVETCGYEPRASTGSPASSFRDDITLPCLPAGEALSAAPERSGAFFKVPPVIEAED